MRRALLSIAAVTGLALALAGCGGSSDSGVKTEGGNAQVTVGVIPIVDVAPIYLGKQKGFFTKQKIDLTLKTATGGAAIVPSVVSGNFQVGFSNFTSLLLAKEKGLPLKVIANGDNSSSVDGQDFAGLVVPKNSAAKTAKDLVGKKIAVNTLKNINDTVVRASIRKAGGDPSTVKFTELAFPDAEAAVVAGRVDAAMLVEPQLTQALSAGAKLVASPYVDIAPNADIAGYFTTEKLLKSDGDLIKRFQAAMKESLAYADAHPDEVRSVLPTYTKIDAALIPKLRLPKFPAEVNKDAVKTLGDNAVSDKVLTKTPDYDALYAS
jgi:NitT/TauT family transport system substrate-binding protein